MNVIFTRCTGRSYAPCFTRILFLIAVLVISLPPPANAQTVQLGSGTKSNSSFPISNTSTYSLAQLIYTAQEMTDAGATAGHITRIRFKPTRSMPTTTWRDWVVYMSHTDRQGFVYSDKAGFYGTMLKVYDGRIADKVNTTDWLEIVLDEAFEWNGTQNIMILIDQNTPGKSPSLMSWQSYDVTPAAGYWRGGFYANNFINPDPARPMDMQRLNTLPQIQFQFEPACTGTPVAGTVPATMTNCPPFTLVSTGASEHAGVKGQWEAAPAGTNSWSAVTGATQATSLLEVPPRVATDYRYRVTCSATGLSSVSDVIQTTIQSVADCYCIVENSGGNPVTTIRFFSTSGALQNVSTIEEPRMKDFYTDYTGHTISQFGGDSVRFTTALNSNYKFSIWVDWNQDGDFTDEGELVYFDGLPSAGILDAGFKVPEDALPGRTRMRIGADWNTQFSDPCPSINNSAQREDFTFEVVPRTACSGQPVAGTVADHLGLPAASHFTLSTTGHSAGVGYGLKGQWETSAPGSGEWLPIEGATGTAFRVEVAPTNETWYRYVLTCTESGLSDVSNVARYTQADIVYPDHQIPPNNPKSIHIKRVTSTGGIANFSVVSGYDGHANFTGNEVSQVMGGSVQIEGYTSPWRGTFAVMVDWNQDGHFNYEGITAQAPNIIGDSIYRVSIHVPHFAKPGRTRMRVTYRNNNNVMGGTEAEDYTFVVIPPACSDLTFPAVIEAKAATSVIYGSGDVNLNLSTSLPWAQGLTYQWQSSADGQAWQNLGPASDMAAKKVTGVSASAHYRALIYCGGTLQGTSASTQVTVEQAKEIVTTKDGERCTPGTLTLEAYGEPGTAVDWYDSPTSSVPIFTGNVFETPALTQSKTYYASVRMDATDIIGKRPVGDGKSKTNAIRKGRGPSFNPYEYDGDTPFKTYFVGKYQYLIRAEELEASGLKAGPIHALSFDVTSATGAIFPNMIFSMKNTGRLQFTSGPMETDMQQVYVGDVKPHVGETTINFQVPFNWDGTSNVVVSICNQEQANGNTATGADVKFDFISFSASAEPSYGFWAPMDCENTGLSTTGIRMFRPRMSFEGTTIAEGPRVPVHANLTFRHEYATSNSGQSKQQTPNVMHEYVNDQCEKLADVLSTADLGAVDVQVFMGENPQTADGMPFVGRYFTITPTRNFNTPSVITLYFNEAEIAAYNNYVQNLSDPRFGAIDLQNPQSIRVYGYHGQMNVGGAGPNGFDTTNVMVFAPTDVEVKDGNVAITFTTLGFSGFYINGILAGPLAISMGDISAQNKGPVNVLTWNTYAEEDGDWFDIERSVHGGQFEVIARIPAKGRASNYQFIDEQPVPGYNYYRLGLNHFDGSRKSYTKVVTARSGDRSLHLEAYPNPAVDNLVVKINGSIQPNAVLQVVDISGKLIKVVPVSKATTTVSLSQLRAGVYLLKYKDDSQQATLKVIKK